MLYKLDHTAHLHLEEKALRNKIEKLEAWMYMYRAGKIEPAATRHVLDIFIMLIRTKEEYESFLTRHSRLFKPRFFTN